MTDLIKRASAEARAFARGERADRNKTKQAKQASASKRAARAD